MFGKTCQAIARPFGRLPEHALWLRSLPHNKGGGKDGRMNPFQSVNVCQTNQTNDKASWPCRYPLAEAVLGLSVRTIARLTRQKSAYYHWYIPSDKYVDARVLSHTNVHWTHVLMT